MNSLIAKKIQSYTLLAMTGSLFLNTGCKKDDGTNKNENFQDPSKVDIEFYDINDISVEALLGNSDYKLIDINRDGTDDFVLSSNYYEYDKYTNIYGIKDVNEISIKNVEINNNMYLIAKDLSSNDDVKFEDFYYYAYTSLEFSIGNSKFSEGFQGKGDKIIGVKFMIKDNIHFGWLKVNVDKNAKKLTLKEVAYNKVAGETIKAGQKK